ncbi:NEW3 domain-containing protein [Chloroflexota bacterium]
MTASLLSYLCFPTVLLAQEINVDLSLRILPEYYYKEVIPEEDNTLFMEIRNNGDNEITNISFDSDKPEGWIVDFSPGSIDYLRTGSSQTVDINIIPTNNTARGDYYLTVIAEANETRTVISAILRVERGSSLWLWVGLGIATLVVAGFIAIFLRFGRQ